MFCSVYVVFISQNASKSSLLSFWPTAIWVKHEDLRSENSSHPGSPSIRWLKSQNALHGVVLFELEVGEGNIFVPYRFSGSCQNLNQKHQQQTCFKNKIFEPLFDASLQLRLLLRPQKWWCTWWHCTLKALKLKASELHGANLFGGSKARMLCMEWFFLSWRWGKVTFLYHTGFQEAVKTWIKNTNSKHASKIKSSSLSSTLHFSFGFFSGLRNDDALGDTALWKLWNWKQVSYTGPIYNCDP